MRIELPVRLQAPQVEELLAALRGVPADEPLTVDGSAVTHVDTAGVQLLLSLLKSRPEAELTTAPCVDAAAKTLGVELRRP